LFQFSFAPLRTVKKKKLKPPCAVASEHHFLLWLLLRAELSCWLGQVATVWSTKRSRARCVILAQCAMGMVMAGTGDLDAFRMLRRLRAVKDTHYGTLLYLKDLCQERFLV
jgi:hypothetical protein